MKTTIAVVVLAGMSFASVAAASSSPKLTPALNRMAAAGMPLKFEAAGRKGSHRVGGSGRSGKGGKYVGGRRK